MKPVAGCFCSGPDAAFIIGTQIVDYDPRESLGLCGTLEQNVREGYRRDSTDTSDLLKPPE
jgi:hypothetical protein